MSRDLGVSEAEIQRRCLRAVRDHDDPHSVLQPFAEEDVTVVDVRDELAALRERVAALEDDTTHSPEKESADAPRARSHSPETIDAEWVSEHGDWTAAESAETPAKNAALADAYQRIQTSGELPTSTVIDVYDDHDLDVAKSTWRGEVLTVLGTLPHIKAPERGQSKWEYVDE
ncbi:MAG: hypothetical protein ABEI57_00625 [Halapricum sp.]